VHHPPQGREPPAQHQPLHGEETEPGSGQPAPEALPETGDLGLQGGAALRDAEGVALVATRRELPHDAEGQGEEGRPVGAEGLPQLRMPGRRWGGKGDIEPEGGPGAPDHLALAVHHLGVEPGARGREPRVRKHLGHAQAQVGVQVRRPQQQVQLGLQAVACRGLGTLAKAPVEGGAGQSEEAGQHDARGDEKAGVQGEGSPHTSTGVSAGAGAAVSHRNRYPLPRRVSMGSSVPSGSSLRRNRPTRTSRTLLSRSASSS